MIAPRMIGRRQALLGLTASLATSLIPLPLRAASGFRPLFDGKSLDGWTATGDANWAVKDGAIQADAGTLGFLLSRERYRDFELRAEIWLSEAANSGIFIRVTNPADITTRNAYEVNLFDRRPDPSFGTGAIVDVAKVAKAHRSGGQWNMMLIRAQGDRFDVTLNGEKTVEGARDAANRDGLIALQYGGGGVVKFRAVEMRGL